MVSLTDGDSYSWRPDTQDSANIPWHLYRIHPVCFTNRAFSEDEFDDVRVFRESIIRLPEREIASIVTVIQKVRHHVSDNLLFVFNGTHLFKLTPFQCINGCSMEGELTSQRLKLLQDISSSSGLLPESYWISGVSKGKKIFVGGEATVYLGHRGGEVVVVREFHPVQSGGLDKSEIERMKVCSFHCCMICSPW